MDWGEYIVEKKLTLLKNYTQNMQKKCKRKCKSHRRQGLAQEFGSES